MALNPQLLPGMGPNSPPFPAPYAQELILLSRDQCGFKLDGPRQYKFSGKGVVYLTNYRLVFVPTKPTAEVRAIELPLLFVSREDVKQPIFGANYLCGIAKPVDAPTNSSEEIKWKLSFINGGMGTMVPLFYATMEYLRVASRRRQEMPVEEQALAPEKTMEPPPFLQTALLDPSDPTKIYLTQPVSNTDEKPKFPVV